MAGFNGRRQRAGVGVLLAAVIGFGLAACTTLSPQPVRLVGATAITAGAAHTCVLMPGGTVKCWGWNDYGQLGTGTNSGKSVAFDVVGISGATAIAAGASSTCAVVAGGVVKCWGENAYGELGNGTNSESWSPVDVAGVAGRDGRDRRFTRVPWWRRCGQVLGQERVRPVGRRDHDRVEDAGRCGGGVRCDRCHRGQRVHLCAAGGWHGQVLGQRCPSSTRRRRSM